MGFNCLLRWFVCLSWVVIPQVSFSLYESNIQSANEWLASQQNTDGSWGDGTQKFIATAEVVKALRASGIREEAYYRGVTWLENHAGNNIDYDTRRAVALETHGNDVGAQLLATLGQGQDTTALSRDGWGLTKLYLQSALDTALVLDGLRITGTSSGNTSISLQPALDFMKADRISNAGWSTGLTSTTDLSSTAQVLKGLAPWQSQDATLAPLINNALSYLQTNVTTSSPVFLRALSAHAALLASNTGIASLWLNSLNLDQATNGSWNNGSVFDTALAMRTLATADGLDSVINQTAVSIPDENLRAAINAALGRGALDALERGELEQLTSLDISNANISDLTGLEFATNLTSLDARNNNISSTLPIDNLPVLVTKLLSGNPVSAINTSSDEEIPTLPEWGMIFMVSLLLWLAYRRQQDSNHNKMAM